jgi:heme/copper-type cytochrome/quinol oxidase subunit 2
VQKLYRGLKSFEADTRGSVTILSAIALTILLAFASLGAEYGAGLLQKSENQRIADSAAFIGSAYCANNSECSTTTTLAVATAIAQNIGSLNGVPAADVTAQVVTSPSGTSGAEALEINVSTTKYLMITEIEGAPNFLSLTAQSYGQIGATASVSGCIVSLSSTTGITLNGGTSITAPSCSVATNNTLTVPCGTTLTAKTISYNTTAPSVGCSGMTPSAATKAAITDPLASAPQVTAAEGRLSTVTAMTNPAAPTVTVSAASGGTTWPAALTNLGYYPTTTVTDATTQCSASWNGTTSVWTITGCAAGTYNINSAIVNGPGISFMPGGSSSSVYNFNVAVNTNYTTSSFGPGTYNFLQSVTASGTTAFGVESTSSGTTTFGAGTYNFGSTLTTAGTTVFGYGNFNFAQSVTLAGTTIFAAATARANNATIATTTFPNAAYTYNFAQGLTAGGGATSAFGYGTFNFGPTSGSCSSGYSICNTSTLLTFEGSSAYPGTFTLSNGIYSGGGTVLSMGAGSTSNSFIIGKAADGNALNFGGGPTVTFGDATCSGCVFQLNGNLVNGGGSCTIVSAAAEHDINGSMNVQGGTVLGSGVYTLAGYFGAGINSGGAVTCPVNGVNTTVGVYGNGVTITYGADAAAYTSGGLSYGFYVAAGFTDFTLLAPTSSSAATENLAIAGPASGGTAAGVFFGSGASNAVVSGAIYSPTGPFYMSGGASIGNGSSGCLEIVANSVTLTGGTAAASTCITGASGVSSSSSISSKIVK